MTQRWLAVHGLLHRFGLDLVRHPGSTSTVGRRWGHFREWGIDLVVDVGANTGQYGRSIRAMGYRGRIVSLEPLPAAYQQLERAARADDDWRTVKVGLGRRDAKASLHVAANSYSSSFFAPTAAHLGADPAVEQIGSVEVEVRRLEGMADALVGAARRPLLKLDTQGSELDILEGTGDAMRRFVALHVELSLVPMYEGAPLMADVVDWLERRGYVVAELEPELSDPAGGRLLQVNGLFVRDRYDVTDPV
jgi:FkbM family methyltransferase